MSALPLAITAGVVGALLEYPLGNAFPLKDPVSIQRRMIVAGLLVGGSVLIAMKLRSGQTEKKALKSLEEMKDLTSGVYTELNNNDCKSALSNAGKAAVVSGNIEGVLSRTSPTFKTVFQEANDERMKSRDALAAKCFK
jgi:hypothetical protein